MKSNASLVPAHVRRKSKLLTRFSAVLCTALAAVGMSTQVAAQSAPDVSKELAVVKRNLETPQLKSALQFVEDQIANPADVVQDSRNRSATAPMVRVTAGRTG